MPQPMLIREKPILAAVSSQFIVDPSRRSTMAGLQLLKTFLSGPQELSIADEASEYSRKLWNGFGGSTAFLQSIYWARIFRPAQFLISRLGKRRGATTMSRAAGPICRIADAIAAAVPGNPFTTGPPVEHIEEPTPEMLLACMSEVSRKWTLRPAYERRSLVRLLATLEQRKEQGPLRKGIVRNTRNGIAGWYIYHAKQGGLGEVLQIGAEESSHGRVLNHLFFDAWHHGVAALSGRLEPEFMDELRKRHCLLHHRGYWTLVHSRNPDALQAIRCGDAFLTRLEGEWCMHFQKSMFDSAGIEKEMWAVGTAPASKLMSASSPVRTCNRPT